VIADFCRALLGTGELAGDCWELRGWQGSVSMTCTGAVQGALCAPQCAPCRTGWARSCTPAGRQRMSVRAYALLQLGQR